jgi:4-amino-4-deoxy-L-arabinose transferase-like glycosyltransferase
LSALVLASSWAFYLSSQFLTLDMTLSAFLTAALCSFFLAQRWAGVHTLQRKWMALAWASAALAFLSKGLVALAIPGLALVAYSLWMRDVSVWRQLRPLMGSGLFVLITAPWLVAIQMKNPEFLEFFFVQEHFSRFLQAGHSRPGAWWYYAPVLLLGALPWTPLLIQRVWESRLRSPVPHVAGPRFSPAKFCVAWTIVTVAFFSASQSKLPAYVMPVFPALALLVGLWLRRIGIGVGQHAFSPQRRHRDCHRHICLLAAFLPLHPIGGRTFFI